MRMTSSTGSGQILEDLQKRLAFSFLKVWVDQPMLTLRHKLSLSESLIVPESYLVSEESSPGAIGQRQRKLALISLVRVRGLGEAGLLFYVDRVDTFLRNKRSIRVEEMNGELSSLKVKSLK